MNFSVAAQREGEWNTYSNRFIYRAQKLCKRDKDFLVGLWALRVAQLRTDAIELDSEQWRCESNLLLIAYNLEEKRELEIDEMIDFPDRVIRRYHSLNAIKRFRAKSTSLFRRIAPRRQ